MSGYTDEATLAAEAVRMLDTLRLVAGSGGTPSPMIACYGRGWRRWTAVLSGLSRRPDGRLDWGRIPHAVRLSLADGLVFGGDALAKEADGGPRPLDDAVAGNALAVEGWLRRAGGTVGVGGLCLPYGVGDDGRPMWGETAATGSSAGGEIDAAMGCMLRLARVGYDEPKAVAALVADGHQVVDGRGRTWEPA